MNHFWFHLARFAIASRRWFQFLKVQTKWKPDKSRCDVLISLNMPSRYLSFLRVERINSEFISISRFTWLQHMSWLLARPLSHFVDSIIHSILFFVAQQQPCDCFQLLQNSFNFTWNSLRYFHKWTYYQSLETTILFFYHNKTSNFRND